MKTFSVLILAFGVAIQGTLAQLRDDFRDGNLSEDPTWIGSLTDFTITNDEQLQLNAKVAGSSWLSTQIALATGDAIEWQLFLRQSFAPSANNYGRYYLVADQPDLSLPLNGYFVQFGEAGGNDAVELFRQSGTSVYSICRATDTKIASPFSIRVKVVRYDPGVWELNVDYTGGPGFEMEATGTDDIFPAAGYVGFRCSYTITNATRFYFDDITVKSFNLPDTTAPQVRSLKVESSNSLVLHFNEPLDASSLSPSNFYVNPAGGKASDVQLLEDSRTVRLQFSGFFKNGSESLLDVEGVKDLSGNVMDARVISFLFFAESPVGFRDILVSEIYADPTPSHGLPEYEFVELFNRSDNPVNLTGWTLSDGTTVALFDSVLLLPATYLLLTPKASSTNYGVSNVLGLAPFPSLNNSGDGLILTSDEGHLIDSVNYNLTWYRDTEKQEGGWSLEVIDVQNICDDAPNWSASEGPTGGTPGMPNSVMASRPDNFGPGLQSIGVVNPTTISLIFTEKLDRVPPTPEQLTIVPPLKIRDVTLDQTLTKLHVSFYDEIESGIEYVLTVSSVYDCPGNIIKEDQCRAMFLLPQEAEPFDVIINEILFNPRPTGVDFVELYNRSEKTIDLKGWMIRNAASQMKTLSTENLLLRGGEYCVLTPDRPILKSEYTSGAEQTFRELQLPAFNDESGNVTLLTPDRITIDSVFYHEEMHSPFLKNAEGVSLERISTERAGASNWSSANAQSGFATPGYLNSSARNHASISEAIEVKPEVIQLNGGPGEFAQILYHFERSGLIANIRIYDHQGRSVRELANNELLGTNGFFRWDGDCDNGSAASSGSYLVWFEVFDVEGSVSTFRKRIAVY